MTDTCLGCDEKECICLEVHEGELELEETMAIYKVSAEGDTMYIEAADQQGARRRLFQSTGPIPETLLTWEIVSELPEGEELL